MAGWFAKLMQKRPARPPHAIAGAGAPQQAEVARDPEARDARHNAIVQMLRYRDAEDRGARERRLRRYTQFLESEPGTGGASDPSAPVRLHRFRTKVPCRVTPEARALLDEITRQYSGSAVTFPEVTSRQQAVMLTGAAGTEPTHIGWVEHCVQTDPRLCNVRHQGLSVETDGGTMLVLRFRYPSTAVRMSSRPDPETSEEVASVDFTEIRPALDLRPSDRSSSPRLVSLTRQEVETMNALRSRDYEAFYVRFKREVQAGIWSSLSGLLSTSPGSLSHRGSYYTVVREPDTTKGRIDQSTVDDSGRAVDIGADRTYDAGPATDVLLLYLEGDILADFADIYFTLQSLGSADAYFLKEEFFTVIRRFWASAESLSSRGGGDLAAVVRMSQRAVPTIAQAPLLKQDWTNLRQSLVDRYGEGGRKAADLVGHEVHRPRTGPPAWPFASFPAGEVNVGLRLVYRQEWRQPRRGAEDLRSDETTLDPRDTSKYLDDVVGDAVGATVDAMKWPLDLDGSINTGVRGLAARTELGLEAEYRESSRDTSARLSDTMRRMAGRIRDESAAAVSAEPEVLTRPAGIQNVVLVAEKLPTPAEIDRSWVRRHDWILAKVLLDESFRDALDTIGQEAEEPEERLTRAVELDAQRGRLYEHLRANILHYQRAIWQQEDPQQRSMRYRKSGKKVPLEWRFELESGGGLTIDELDDRLAGQSVDGQFAAYSMGREADLDQVIDPAGPVGYYGNYAIYQMRPEFGSDDLFSMLHFFKSPYLRPNPDTGEPEVDDPVQIQISEERVVMVASDRAIDATRSADPAPEKPERTDGLIVAGEATEWYRPMADSGRGTGLLRANGHRDAAADWALLRGAGERTPSLRAGAGDPSAPERAIIARSGRERRFTMAAGARAAPTPDWTMLAGSDRVRTTLGAGAPHADEQVILAGVDEERAPGLRAGPTPDSAAERVIVARDDEGPKLTAAAGAGIAQSHGPTIVSADDGEQTPSLRAGAGAPQGHAPAVLARDDRGPALTAVAGAGAPEEHAHVIHAGDGEGLRLTTVAGAGAPHAHEQRVILAGGDGEATPSLRACSGTPHAHERVILARDDEWLRPSLVAG